MRSLVDTRAVQLRQLGAPSHALMQGPLLHLHENRKAPAHEAALLHLLSQPGLALGILRRRGGGCIRVCAGRLGHMVCRALGSGLA